MNTDMVSDINQSLGISLTATGSLEELRQQLAVHINHLINHDFEKLVYYLYRIDVNESKMRKLLQQQEGEGAALLIADLIIERQLQKIKSRKKFGNTDNFSDEDRW